MPSAEDYRAKAAEFFGMAEIETDGRTKAGYISLAKSYERLAEQADLNAPTEIVYEPPLQNQIIVKPAAIPEPITSKDETPDSEIV